MTHDGDHRRTDHLDHVGGVLEQTLYGFVLQLLFHRDDLGVGAERACDLLNQFGVKRLIDRDHDAAHQQRGN